MRVKKKTILGKYFYNCLLTIRIPAKLQKVAHRSLLVKALVTFRKRSLNKK